MPVELAFLCFLMLWTSVGMASDQPARQPDQLDQTIERLSKEVAQGDCMVGTHEIRACYDYYERRYKSEAELTEIAPAVFKWQVFASNVVLALLVLLTVSGVILVVVQTWWMLFRFTADPGRQVAKESGIEFGPATIKLQTTIVGLLVLIVAYGFLIIFLHEVYNIRVVSVAAPTNSVLK